MPIIRVGFLLGNVGWRGGINYYKNLLFAIKNNPESKIQPVLIFGLKSDAKEFEGLGEVFRTSLLDRLSPLWFGSKLMQRVGRDYLSFYVLRKYNVDIFSHEGVFWKGCSMPTLAWIPDFQHVHLKSFFSPQEIKRRNSGMTRKINSSSAVLLSSQDAHKDLEVFALGSDYDVYILRFISCLILNSEADESTLRGKYQLDRPWFYIPNQFWEHKNHTVVIEALKLMKEAGEDCPLIVCSGSTIDYRNPDYFRTLLKKVRNYGLEKHFIILGSIPYSDVGALMKYSMAVINPSLFEGWNTAVEEAKAMGKEVVLSDLAVHREQSPERCQYFNVNDSGRLKKILGSIQSQFDRDNDFSIQGEAQVNHKEKVKEFAKQYESIVLQVLSHSSKLYDE